MKLVVATHNGHKLTEVRRVLTEAISDLDVVGLAEIGYGDDPAETEFSFEANALLKARACATNTGAAALADDSGLEVKVLNWMPGIRSARWAGPTKNDRDNLELVLAQIADVDDPHRHARFVCAMALVLPDGTEMVVRGVMNGKLVKEPRGSNGFGYDPIFVADGCDRTNAELTADEKDAISHRGDAVRQMIAVLQQLRKEHKL